jgi:hypothetical protein
MPILYDYLTLVGETNWYAAPAAVISTKNVESIRTSASGPQTALTGPEVIAVATGNATPAPAAQPAVIQQKQPEKPATKSHSQVKKVSAP